MSLPQTLNNLTELQVLEFPNNQLTGSHPSLAGLTQLQNLLLSNNNFTTIPSDFFDGMTSLQHVYLDYNAFASWFIPDSLKSASNLQVFSATSANITGKIPDFFSGDTFVGLTTLHLSFNSLEDGPSVTLISPSSCPPGGQKSPNGGGGKKSSNIEKVVGSVVCGVCVMFIAGMVGICVYKRKRKHYSAYNFNPRDIHVVVP